VAKPSKQTIVHAPFEQALDQDWRDWTTRRVYADWLEEHDQPMLAFAQRWMARHQLAPARRTEYNRGRVIKPWGWFPPRDPTEGLAPRHSRLPYAVFVTLLGSQFPITHLYYVERAEAERDLAKALHVLRKLLEPDLK
jgi:uncharacterized protein (TIGR02996 family)